MTQAAVLAQLGNTPLGMRNKIINGAMEIDQRNAGASVTPSTGTYTLDRWRCFNNTDGSFTIQQSSTSPNGFKNSIVATVTSTDSSLGTTQQAKIQQKIEGFTITDLGFGTANAKTVTLSFWVRSSVTGTYGVGFINEAGNRSYVATYNVNSANTWEQKSITIIGDTSGTWATSNTTGLNIQWSLGMGADYQTTEGSWVSDECSTTSSSINLLATNGATFYLTGVQLEVGSVATEFERRQYGTELALCQRYYTKSFNTLIAPSNGSSTTTLSTYYGAYTSVIDRPSTGGPPTANDSTTAPNGTYGSLQVFPVTMRTNPSVTYYGNSNGNWWLQGVGSGGATWYGPQGYMPGVAGFAPTFASPISTDAIGIVFGHWTASAEL